VSVSGVRPLTDNELLLFLDIARLARISARQFLRSANESPNSPIGDFVPGPEKEVYQINTGLLSSSCVMIQSCVMNAFGLSNCLLFLALYL